MIIEEWSRTSDDILFRRSKLGLSFSKEEIKRLDQYLDDFFKTKKSNSNNNKLNSNIAEIV